MSYQIRAKEGKWLHGFYRAYSAGTVAYAAWTVFLILALPWLFGRNLEAVEDLPLVIQDIVYDQPEPVLLKCYASPHIYLLENGRKRWIDTIETFNTRGYVWDDVHLVPCPELRQVPDGISIPADAGPPPDP